MKKLNRKERQRQLRALADGPYTKIDTSDIPQLTKEQMVQAVRGKMYRPIRLVEKMPPK